MDVFCIKVSSLLLKLRVIEYNKTCSVTLGGRGGIQIVERVCPTDQAIGFV